MDKNYGAIYQKTRYEWRKINKICTVCGKAEAEEGKTLCPACKIVCSEKQKQYYHSLSLERKQELAARSKAVREERKAAGLCISCGEPVFKGLFCEKHYYARQESNRKYKAKKRGDQND